MAELNPNLKEVIAWALASLVAFTFAYRFDFFKLRKIFLKSDIDFGDVLGAFIVFLAMELLFAPLAVYGYFSYVERTQFPVYTQRVEALIPIFTEVVLILGFGGYCWLKRRKVEKFFNHGSFFTSLLLGLVTWFLAIPIASFISSIINLILQHTVGQKPSEQNIVKTLKTIMEYPEIFWVISFFIIFVTPIIEELLFRGFLQGWLKSIFGWRGAILLSSIIFALFHFSIAQGWDNVTILTILFVLSCFLGFLYEKQKTLVAPIGLHMAFNAVTIGMIFFTGG